MNNKIISFQSIPNNNIPIKFLIENLTNCEVKLINTITNKTLQICSEYLSDYMCSAFKYTLANYIESLENGANIIIHIGERCSLEYYFEFQKQILEELGYKFEFYCLINKDKNKIFSLYKILKKLNPNIKVIKFLYYLSLTFLMTYYMNKLDIYIRKNIGFEINEGSFDRVKKSMVISFSKTKGFIDLIKKYFYFKKKFKNIPLDKPKNCLKIGIVGMPYIFIDENSNYFIEKKLANMNIEVSKFPNETFLFLSRPLKEKYYLGKIKKYCKYSLGSNVISSIEKAKILINKGYDGIIHIKSFGCTPEIGGMKILEKLCNDENMPLMFLNFDIDTSKVEIKTRLEAFYDMLIMNRKKR